MSVRCGLGSRDGVDACKLRKFVDIEALWLSDLDVAVFHQGHAMLLLCGHSIRGSFSKPATGCTHGFFFKSGITELTEATILWK